MSPPARGFKSGKYLKTPQKFRAIRNTHLGMVLLLHGSDSPRNLTVAKSATAAVAAKWVQYGGFFTRAETFCFLECNFRCKLHQPWVGRFDDLSKGLAVTVSIDGHGAEKLSVVEGVERLQTELQLFRFAQLEVLQQREIEVHGARAIERPPRSGSGASQRVRNKCRSIEVRQAIARIMIQVQRAPDVVRPVQTVIVDAIRQTSLQGIVSVAVKADRKAGADTSDSGKSPAVDQ